MTSTTFFFNLIPLLAFILLVINLILAPHNPYLEKLGSFECGFHSFLGQNRTQFSISFFIFGLLFLLFDLEILLIYPYAVTGYTNDIYGLVIMVLFFLLLTLGFSFEIGKNALKIYSRQTFSNVEEKLPFVNSSRNANVFSNTITTMTNIIYFCVFFTDVKNLIYLVIRRAKHSNFLLLNNFFLDKKKAGKP